MPNVAKLICLFYEFGKIKCMCRNVVSDAISLESNRTLQNAVMLFLISIYTVSKQPCYENQEFDASEAIKSHA